MVILWHHKVIFQSDYDKLSSAALIWPLWYTLKAHQTPKIQHATVLASLWESTLGEGEDVKWPCPWSPCDKGNNPHKSWKFSGTLEGRNHVMSWVQYITSIWDNPGWMVSYITQRTHFLNERSSTSVADTYGSGMVEPWIKKSVFHFHYVFYKLNF